MPRPNSPREGSVTESRLIRERDLIGPTTTAAKYSGLSNQAKSLVLAERVRELVPFKKSGDSWVIDGLPTSAAVKTLVEEVTNMWPRGTDTSSLFTARSNGHNVLYWGKRYPSGIRRAATRAALYADQIFVVNPFIDNFVFHPQQSPLVDPDGWIGAYAASAAFVNELYPWIKAGIVELVPNPGMLDFQLGNALITRAQNEQIELGRKHVEFMERHMTAMAAEGFMFMTDEDRHRVYKNMGGLSESEQREIDAEVDRIRQLDPDVARVVQASAGRLIRTGTGANFPTVQLLAESLGASIVSDDAFCMDRLRMSVDVSATPAQHLSDSFQALQFSFLNDVPASLVLDCRQADGLVKFRRFLQDVSSLTSVSNSKSSYEQKVKECSDRLADEYNAYKTEWSGLERKFAKDALIITPTLAGAAAVVSGKIDPVAIGTTCLTGLVKSLFDFWTKRKSHASKPLGVLLKIDESQ